MTDPVCEYCGEEPCTCPVFDIEDEGGGPDNPICIDSDEDIEKPDL